MCRDEGNCHGVRSGAFLGVWPVDGEKGCPIPNSQRTLSPSLAFSPRGPQRLLVLTDSLGPTSWSHRRAAPWSCARLLFGQAFCLALAHPHVPGSRPQGRAEGGHASQVRLLRTEDTIAGVSCKLFGLQPEFLPGLYHHLCDGPGCCWRHVTTKVGMSQGSGAEN